MAEKGLVLEIKDGYAVVKMVRTEACAKCRACAAGLSEKEMLIEAENACDAKAGNWVEIQLAENGFYNAVIIMYGIPLIGLLAGILGGFYLLAPLVPSVPQELVSFGLGIIGTAIGFLWIRSQEERWKKKKYRPMAISITEPDA